MIIEQSLILTFTYNCATACPKKKQQQQHTDGSHRTGFGVSVYRCGMRVDRGFGRCTCLIVIIFVGVPPCAPLLLHGIIMFCILPPCVCVCAVFGCLCAGLRTGRGLCGLVELVACLYRCLVSARPERCIIDYV